MINGFVSSKVILSRLYKELGPTVELSESDCIEWMADAMAMIGSYYQYTEFTDMLELDNGRVRLPNNFYRMIDLTYNGSALSWSSNSFVNDYYCDDCELPISCCTEYNFYINDSYIITNIKTESPENKLCVRYLGVAIDTDGYPMVPDDIYFFKACVAYITYLLDYREWRKGNIPDKVQQKSEREWLFYVNAARGSANMPGIAQLENLKNIMVRLIPSQNQYRNNFRDISKPENRTEH